VTDEDRETHEKIEKALKGTFRPEFLNRIDEIILFSPLTVEQMEKIVSLQMKEIQERLAEYGVKVELTAAARKWLAKTGYDPAFGARPLRRALQKFVESPLSVELLGGKIPSGASVVVDTCADDSGLEFKTKEGKGKKEKEEEKEKEKEKEKVKK
jgi:ATP-dependent Clp protease ATP-binding subunit ClpC